MATTLKVEITVREDDDRVVVKTLEGEEAKKWECYMKTVCTLAFAHKILNKPPMALRRTKEFFTALSTNRAGDITYADAHLGLATFASEDMGEAVTAFTEKRDGKFRNR